jgi:hypothetical protein
LLTVVAPTGSAALLLCIALAFTGCGGSSPPPSENTKVAVLVTSTANDQISEFGIVFNSLTLTGQSGGTANLISAPINAEFLHVNGTTEPLLSSTAPQGVYTSATASIGSSAFTCYGIDPSNGDQDSATYAYEYTPASNVTVSLPSPLTIAGKNTVVLLNLQVSQSANFPMGDCLAGGLNYSITPAFTLTPVSSTSPTEFGLRGFVDVTTASDSSFTVTAAEGTVGLVVQPADQGAKGPVWQIATDADTVYQGIGGFSELGTGMSVDMDAVLQQGGSLLAKRIGVYNTDPTNLSMEIGPLGGYDTAISAFIGLPVEILGPLNIGPYPFNFGDTAFQISGQFSNLSSLPFPASFDVTNVVPGQNIYASTYSLVIEPAPTNIPAITVTLLPQTINGTVSAIGSEGGFTTYTITLAPYDIFPQFDVQTSLIQNSVITNPSTVVVYADSNTQMLNTVPLAVGSVVRFYGLVFNDNGTLRMDCAQVLDGVAE